MDYSTFESAPLQQNKKPKHMFTYLLIITLAVGVYNVWKPLPPEISMKGNIATVPESSVKFLADFTYTDSTGSRKSDQTIFDEIFKMINEANEYILIDMFLFNSWKGAGSEDMRKLSDELTNALITKKKTIPDISITVISDPINTVYGGNESIHFKKLREANIHVVETNLSALRDSNPIYSAFWRTLISWWTPLHRLVTGVDYSFRKAPNPFGSDGTPTTIRSYLSLLNFKANHRKLIVTDFKVGSSTKIATLVTSGNPHDASSAHTNVAIRVDDSIWRSAVDSEQAVAQLSKESIITPKNAEKILNETGNINIRLLTEGKIKETAIEMLKKPMEGDGVDISMFYLSDRKIIGSLIDASKRGANVRLVLDPNKDAFGHEKNGVPNRPVASELLKKSAGKIQIRWCDTHGEQCHSKLLLTKVGDVHSMLLGSANFTRRNIGDYNLETDVWVEAPRSFKAFAEAKNYFETIWTNTDEKKFTTNYETYKDDTTWHYILYRLMEGLGTSSF